MKDTWILRCGEVIPHKNIQSNECDIGFATHIDTFSYKNVYERGQFPIIGVAPEYYGAAEPPVRRGVSHLSGLTEPPIYSYSACAGSKPYTSLMERSFDGSMLSMLILYES